MEKKCEVCQAPFSSYECSHCPDCGKELSIGDWPCSDKRPHESVRRRFAVPTEATEVYIDSKDPTHIFVPGGDPTAKLDKPPTRDQHGRPIIWKKRQLTTHAERRAFTEEYDKIRRDKNAPIDDLLKSQLRASEERLRAQMKDFDPEYREMAEMAIARNREALKPGAGAHFQVTEMDSSNRSAYRGPDERLKRH